MSLWVLERSKLPKKDFGFVTRGVDRTSETPDQRLRCSGLTVYYRVFCKSRRTSHTKNIVFEQLTNVHA